MEQCLDEVTCALVFNAEGAVIAYNQAKTRYHNESRTIKHRADIIIPR